MGAQFGSQMSDWYDEFAYEDEAPVHEVKISSYAIGKTEVTQALWNAIGIEPNENWTKLNGLGDDFAAYNISVSKIEEFIDSLNNRLHSDGQLIDDLAFALPTEAQWEYAAQGGIFGRRWLYSGSISLDSVGWYSNNSHKAKHPVASKKPNRLGIYDMCGGVWEWTCETEHDYNNDNLVNPMTFDESSKRCVRGGSSFSVKRQCRITNRYCYNPNYYYNDFGFRLVLVYND